MSTFEFLTELKNQGIDIAVNGERLKLNAPKGMLTPDLKAELGRRKEEIIHFLKKAESISDQPQMSQIAPIDRHGILPISPAQERVWALYRLEPNSTALNIPVIWELNGRIDPNRLEKALNQMVARQEILRAYFPEVDDVPQTKLLPTYHAPLHKIVLEDLPDPEGEALRLLNEDISKRPFDITQAPPYRFVLYQLDDETAILLINFHQIIFDWSAYDTLVQEINTHYNNQTSSSLPPLPELTLQYVDFANWEQELRQGPTAEKLNAYWHEKLNKPYHLLHIPKSINRHQPQSLKVKFEVEPNQLSALRHIAKQNGTTMFVLMLSMVKAMLSKYAPEEEVMLFTSTGQSKVDFAHLLGLFANLILLRTNLAGNPTFSNLLSRVKDTTLSAIAHQNLPLEDILEHLQWRSNAEHNNLFQVIFIYQQPHECELELEQLSSELLSAGEHLGAFDIRLFIEDLGETLYGEFEFNSAHYDVSFIESLKTQFEMILSAVTTNEQLPLQELVSRDETAVLPSTTPQIQHVSPRDEIEQQLLALWQEILKIETISINDNFFTLGGHSLLAARLFAKIQKNMGKNLPLASLIHSPTIKALAPLIREDNIDTEWNSLVPIQTEGSRPPLFLMHGAGGNILLYRDLARDLGPDQPVYGLQAKGLDGQGEYLTDFKKMAACYLQEIRAIQPHGPYYFGGYCLGGALAYEMAQQLKQAGEETALVSMFETFNIHSNPATYDGTYHLIHKAQNLWFHADNILKLPLKGKVAFFKEKAQVQLQRIQQRLSLIMKNRGNLQSDAEMVHVMIDKINDDAHEAYLPEPYNGRVAIFRPIKDFKGMEDPSYGWGELIPEESRVIQYLPVNPKGMMVTPFSQKLAQQLRHLMDESLAFSHH